MMRNKELKFSAGMFQHYYTVLHGFPSIPNVFHNKPLRSLKIKLYKTRLSLQTTAGLTGRSGKNTTSLKEILIMPKFQSFYFMVENHHLHLFLK